VRTTDFDYELPSDRIAQHPADPRDSSRLLVLNRKNGEIQHHIFRDLPQFFTPDDIIVLNETRVIPARLHGKKLPGGGQVELLLLKRLAPQTWETMVGGKGLRAGRRVALAAGITAEIEEDLGGPRRKVHFSQPISPELEDIGEMPLPPYIHAKLENPDSYQTIFAQHPGSAAAPTAGLHFTQDVLDRIRAKGVCIAKITLHVGLDTFVPVSVEDPRSHPIHSEWCQIPQDVVDAIYACKERGGRLIAAGTTSVRALETAARVVQGNERIKAFEGNTDLFILPGFDFKIVDVMLTNFHLPRSTLLMMVSAFAGREQILRTYQIAIEAGYRFYSFGDAMLIL
jgi:S-adenosylmethionine:tRNA ribosyltransferase-isomerase